MAGTTEYEKEPFFIRDRAFYRSLFILIGSLAVQNLVSYSVNMIDNIMLGSYSQNALSGAATVNQIFFMVQQTAVPMGNALVAIASQYWGKGECGPIRVLSRKVLKYSAVVAVLIFAVCSLFPRQLLSLFTTSPEILDEGCAYLNLVRWSFLLFFMSSILMAMLRSVEIVRISVVVSVVSLLVNTCINYTLIFGRFGFPEMGIRGAAVGTITARACELTIILVYAWKLDKRIRLFARGAPDERGVDAVGLSQTYRRVCIPMVVTVLLWAVATPVQTAIMGHLSDDAIAANSIAVTFFQYLKVVVVSVSSAGNVMIGKTIGENHPADVRAAGRTMSVICVLFGIVLGGCLLLLRQPLLSLYSISGSAYLLADHMMIIMSVAMVGMSYQMPVSGFIQSAGDVHFCTVMNLVSTWCIVMPLSFLAAFVWGLPAEAVVICLQSDQIFKGLPVFLRFRKYKWIRILTADTTADEPASEQAGGD